MSIIQLAADIWRKYVIPGVPASGPNEPDKLAIIAWGTWLESTLAASGFAGLAYSTLAALNADLAHGAQTVAIVYNDSTAANDGLYVKSGASGVGSWSRFGDLPVSLIRMTVTGGTANAIVASLPVVPSVPGNFLYLLTPTANCAAGATTVNGTPIKDYFGNDPAANALLNGTPVLMAFSVDHYQLLLPSQVDASGILAAALAAESAAAASASAAAASASALANQVHQYDTRTLAAAATIPSGVALVRVFGYAAAGDGGVATYRKVGSAPSHAGKFQSADGAWWEIRPDGVQLRPEMFSSTADTSAIQTAMDVANAIGANVVQLGTSNYRAVKQGSNDYCLKVYGPVALWGSVATRDGVTAGTGSIISWGSAINTSTDILRWESTSWIQGGCISGLQLMPDGFNANAADISGLTKYGREGINVAGAGLFLNCHIDNCTLGPMNAGHSINIVSNGQWIDGRVDNNYVWGGIYAPLCGDNCRFTDNACNGVKTAFEIGNASGAGTMQVHHNHGIAAGGALVLRSGFKVSVAYNFFEQATAHTGSGYVYDFSGVDGTLQSIEFKHNIAGSVGNHGLTGMVHFANSIKPDIDSNTLVGDPSVTYPIYIDATNLNPICGEVKGGGGFITESIYNPGYYVASPASVAPIGYDVPLTLSNSWITLAGGYEVPRVRRLRDGTCHISGDISSGTTTVATVFATIPAASYYPKHVCIRSGPNSSSGVVNFGINNGSGAMSFRSTGDAAGTGISCSYAGAPIN